MYYELITSVISFVGCLAVYKGYKTVVKFKKMTNVLRGSGMIEKMVSLMTIVIEKRKFEKSQEVFTHKHEKVGKFHYLIDYEFDGIPYKILVKKKRGPNKIESVFNEEEVDVIDTLRVYLGPNEDFHNTVYKPEFFKMRRLRFVLTNGEEQVFKYDEDIILYL